MPIDLFLAALLFKADVDMYIVNTAGSYGVKGIGFAIKR